MKKGLMNLLFVINVKFNKMASVTIVNLANMIFALAAFTKKIKKSHKISQIVESANKD